jgi:hypothetical protein
MNQSHRNAISTALLSTFMSLDAVVHNNKVVRQQNGKAMLLDAQQKRERKNALRLKHSVQ